MGFFGDALNFVGDIVSGGGVSNTKATEATNAAQIDLARQQTDFQERMANTAHQRQVKDLRAAGINPMLSAQLGGAATPTGALAQLQNPNPGQIGAGIANTAKSIYGISQDAQNAKSTRSVQASQSALNEATAASTTTTAKETEANTRVLKQKEREIEAQVKKIKADTIKAKTETVESQTRTGKNIAEMHNTSEDTASRARDNRIKSARESGDTLIAPAKPYIDVVLDSLGAAGSAYKTFKGR